MTSSHAVSGYEMVFAVLNAAVLHVYCQRLYCAAAASVHSVSSNSCD